MLKSDPGSLSTSRDMCWACKHRNLQSFSAAADTMSERYALESIYEKPTQDSRCPQRDWSYSTPSQYSTLRTQSFSVTLLQSWPDVTSITSCAGESDLRSNHWAGETTQQIKCFTMQVWVLEFRTPEPMYKKHDTAVRLESQGTGSRGKGLPKGS